MFYFQYDIQVYNMATNQVPSLDPVFSLSWCPATKCTSPLWSFVEVQLLSCFSLVVTHGC